MFKMQRIESEQAMLEFASRVAKAIESGAVIFLNGPLGAGKTTFTRGFLRAFGYHGKVKSPTYTLVEPYEFDGQVIFHFDFYRLDNASELEHIGLNEYFTRHSICLIEWPEKGFPLLPTPDVICDIAFAGEGREVRVEAGTERGERILAKILHSSLRGA
jgi:tRNA threonylcarbamoyladenosine biosynthesis protein TsaE